MLIPLLEKGLQSRCPQRHCPCGSSAERSPWLSCCWQATFARPIRSPPVLRSPPTRSSPRTWSTARPGAAGFTRSVRRATIALVPEKGQEEVLPLARLLKLTRDGVALRLTPAEGSVVLFPDGDRLYRTVIGPATETTLEVSVVRPGQPRHPAREPAGPDPDRAERDRRGRFAARAGPDRAAHHRGPLAGQRRSSDGGLPRPGRKADQVPGRRPARSRSTEPGSSPSGSTRRWWSIRGPRPTSSS